MQHNTQVYCFVGKMSKRKCPEPTESLQSTKVAKRPGRQGIHLTSQAKYIVIIVRKFFEEEKRTGEYWTGQQQQQEYQVNNSMN